MPAGDGLLGIGAVERETGLSKDVLRKWEQRYGFPEPSRDGNGERVYPGEQIDRLRLIKRLLDAGMRPARVVNQPPEVLADLAQRHAPRASAGRGGDFEAVFLDRLRHHDTPLLRQGLYRLMLRDGLSGFLQGRASALIERVGDAWSRGELQIYEEHLFSDLMQGFLTGVINGLNDERGSPRVLLTTLPGEPHGLGLLMVAAAAALDGAYCLTLGTQTPVLDIQTAARDRLMDVVALSFSGLYPARQLVSGLEELRRDLPAATELWIGGEGASRATRIPDGVRALAELGDVTGAIRDWRRGRTP